MIFYAISTMLMFVHYNRNGGDMGFYVNPPTETKEDFLERESLWTTNKIEWKNVPVGFLPVVHVNNGWVTDANIAYSEQELKALTDSNDPRPKRIFLVKIKDLLPVSGTNFVEYAMRNHLV